MSKYILLVDDDDELKQKLSEQLQKSGYMVKTLPNGKECCKLLEKEKPDLIIVDYFMPEIDGLSVIHNLQNKQLNIPIIMISSDKITANGFLFLRKPFSTSSLLHMVYNIFNN